VQQQRVQCERTYWYVVLVSCEQLQHQHATFSSRVWANKPFPQGWCRRVVSCWRMGGCADDGVGIFVHCTISLVRWSGKVMYDSLRRSRSLLWWTTAAPDAVDNRRLVRWLAVGEPRVAAWNFTSPHIVDRLLSP